MTLIRACLLSLSCLPLGGVAPSHADIGFGQNPVVHVRGPKGVNLAHPDRLCKFRLKSDFGSIAFRPETVRVNGILPVWIRSAETRRWPGGHACAFRVPASAVRIVEMDGQRWGEFTVPCTLSIPASNPPEQPYSHTVKVVLR